MIDREDMEMVKATKSNVPFFSVIAIFGVLAFTLLFVLIHSFANKPEDKQQASSTSQSSSSEEIEYIEVSGKIDSIGDGGDYGCWVSVNNRKFYSNEFKDADFCKLTKGADIKLFVRKEYQFKQ